MKEAESVRVAVVVGVGAGLGAALGGLGQVMARDLGPQGIHVAYVNIDGAIDMPFIHRLRPQLTKEDMLDPAAIAESYWHIAHQGRSAWTQELDVRPFKEQF